MRGMGLVGCWHWSDSAGARLLQGWWSCRHHRRRAGHSHPCPDATAASRCPDTVELTGSEYKGLRPPLVVLDLAYRNLSRSGVLGNPYALHRAKDPLQVLPRPTFPAHCLILCDHLDALRLS